MILITGGAGFIGSHVAEALLRGGHPIAVIDELNDFYSPDWKRRNLEEVRQSGGDFRFFEADIRDEAAMDAAFAEIQPDAVIHLAARAGVRPSLDQALLYESVNVRGTMVLLEACHKYGVRKFLFASSSSIYGISSHVPFREDDPDHLPISPYAATKLAGEKVCFTYSHLYGISVQCLRFFTVYGPRQRPDLAIRKFTKLIDAGLPIPVFGDGSSSRDYTFVTDTVQGVLHALAHNAPFDVFNLGNSNPVPLLTLIRLIENELGKKAVIQWLPDQPGDVPTTFADITKAREILAYDPQTTIEQGIARFVEWFRRARECEAC